MIQIPKKPLYRLTLEELYEEIEIQEEKMDIYTEDGYDHLVADCAWYITEIEDEIEKRQIMKSKYFKCAVSREENGFNAGRVCFISFTEEVSIDEAIKLVNKHYVRYDGLQIEVHKALEKEVEIEPFIEIEVIKNDR